MFLYTVILEFRGGTYISQAKAISEQTAVDFWIRSLDETIPEISSTDRQALAVGFNLEDLAPLTGLINVWCTSGLANGHLALLNIIRTIDSE